MLVLLIIDLLAWLHLLNSDTGANSLASNAYVSMQILTAILTAILILYLKTNLIKSCQALFKISSHLLPFSLWLFLKTRAIFSTNHMQKYNEIDMVLTFPALQLVYFKLPLAHWISRDAMLILKAVVIYT